MNLTADQPCGHAVSMPSQYAGKPERSKNPCLILLYTHYSPPTVCSNYLAPAAPTSLDLSPPEPLVAPLCDRGQQEAVCGRLPQTLLLSLNSHVGLFTIPAHSLHSHTAVSQPN